MAFAQQTECIAAQRIYQHNAVRKVGKTQQVALCPLLHIAKLQIASRRRDRRAHSIGRNVQLAGKRLRDRHCAVRAGGGGNPEFLKFRAAAGRFDPAADQFRGAALLRRASITYEAQLFNKFEWRK